MVLVLWDVDHTLIESRGVGGEVFAAAFHAATGRVLAESAQVQGALEPELFAASCRANGVEHDPAGLFVRFVEAQTALYRERAAELGQRGRVLPGVREILGALAGRRDVVSSVLSGNTAGAGTAKLAAFGLDTLLDLDTAAWGTDAANRSGLAPVAWERASAKYGIAFDTANTVVVGDTAADVAAALVHGIRVIGVATGRAGAEELVDAGATVAFDDLADTGKVLRALAIC